MRVYLQSVKSLQIVSVNFGLCEQSNFLCDAKNYFVPYGQLHSINLAYP